MLLNFKQRLCGNGLPMVELNGDGYADWDCFDGQIEYQIDFDVRGYGVKDIIPSLTSFRLHLEEMDGLKTETISIKDLTSDLTLIDEKGNEYAESWTQMGDAICNGLNISHVVLNTNERILDICMR